MQPQPQSPAPYAPPTPKKPVAGIAVVVVVVVTVVIVAMTFFAFWRSAPVVVTVLSTHILFSISYRVTVDGVVWGEGTLAPLYGVNITGTTSWFGLGDTCRAVVVEGISQGGGFGTQMDQEFITVCHGQVSRVTLLV